MRFKTSSRYDFIDTLRGLAACLVMLQHSLEQSGLLASGWLGNVMPGGLNLGETGVTIFFLVSGFVISLSIEKTSSFCLFWIHRAFRLYPLYITIYILTFILSGGGGIHSARELFVNAISNLLFIQEYVGQKDFVDGSWTLSLEMVWYVAISVAFVLFLNKETNLLVGLSVLISILAQICCATSFHLPMGRLSLLVCCVFGLVCYRRERNDISKKHFAILFGILLITIALNLFVGFHLFPGATPTATFRMAIDSWALAGLIYFLFFFMRRKSVWGQPIFSFLGRISYSIYLLHLVILDQLYPTSLNNRAEIIYITFISSISAAALTYNFIEAPFIRFGHSFKTSMSPRIP